MTNINNKLSLGISSVAPNTQVDSPIFSDFIQTPSAQLWKSAGEDIAFLSTPITITIPLLNGLQAAYQLYVKNIAPDDSNPLQVKVNLPAGQFNKHILNAGGIICYWQDSRVTATTGPFTGNIIFSSVVITGWDDTNGTPCRWFIGI